MMVTNHPSDNISGGVSGITGNAKLPMATFSGATITIYVYIEDRKHVRINADKWGGNA